MRSPLSEGRMGRRVCRSGIWKHKLSLKVRRTEGLMKTELSSFFLLFFSFKIRHLAKAVKRKQVIFPIDSFCA